MRTTNWRRRTGPTGLLTTTCRWVSGIGVVLPCVAVLLTATAVSTADDTKVLRPQRSLDVQAPAMYKPDEFIVVFDREARRQIQIGVDRFGSPTANLPSVHRAIKENGVERIARQFPTRVERILIRQVHSDGHEAEEDERYDQAFEDVAPDKWKCFREPAKIREWAVPGPK